MKIIVGLLFISLGRSRAFTSYTICSQPKNWISNEEQRKATHILASVVEQSDQYDSYYDDLDPSQFDVDNQEEDAEHEYTRNQPNDYVVPTYVQSKFSTSTEDTGEIQALVDERAKARAGRLLRKADEIRVVLFRQYRVNINDKSLEWSVGGDCLGPNGHDYNLAADAGPNQSTLSEPEIHQMLSSRLQHNLIKDSRTASRIRKDLRNAGVKVSDKRREWRADGAFFDGFVALTYVQSELSLYSEDTDEIQALVDERAKAKAEGLSRKADEIRVILLRQFQVNINDKSMEWSVGGDCLGPNGHDYNLAADAGPNQSALSEPEIHEMLSARLQHNLVKDSRTASRIRKDLRNAGVKVSDKRREWRADGAFFTDVARTYVQSEFSTSTADAVVIQALVDERAQARAEGLSRKADEIRIVLFRQYHVNINDRSMEWSVGGGCLGPNGHGYKLAADAGPNQSTLSEPEIHQMLSARLQHNLIKDSMTSSKIRRDLVKAGVGFNDKTREWRADGSFFAVDASAYRYVQSQSSTSTEESDEIQALVDERAQARAEGLSSRADEIRVILFRQYHVNINDKSLEWSVGGGCLGPNGHDYNLAADAGPNQSTLSEPEIHQMMSARLQHNLIKDLMMARKLRDDLRNAGVKVNDKRREWRADGASFALDAPTCRYVQSKSSKSTEHVDMIQALVDERAKAKAEGLSKRSNEIRLVLFRQFQVNVNDKNLEWSVGGDCFGPNGHYYNLTADAGANQSSLTEPEIHEMLATRLQYKLIKDFRTASRLRDDLRNAGVDVNDKTREWRSDGAFFVNELVVKTYYQSELSPTTADADQIKTLVDERAKAMAEGLWAKTDEIREDLFRRFHVAINDKRLEWSVGGVCFGPHGHDYMLGADAGPNQSTLSETEIHQMLSARLQYWLIREYRTVRKIGEDLRSAGVEVNEKRREWRADGACFAPTYVQSNSSRSTEHADEIQALVDERVQARAKRLPRKANEIRRVLFRQFQVNVNDKNLEWSVGGDCFGPNGHDYKLLTDAGPNQSTLSEPEIHQMLAARLQHKLVKDFRMASKLRDDLRNAGVEVNDETREWRADGTVFVNELVVKTYIQSEFSPSTADADQIQTLVDERAKAMAEGLWAKTDEIREDLFRRFNVTINDKRLEWSVGGGCFHPHGHDYKLAADAGPNQSTLSESEIHQLLATRRQHWLIKDYSTANKIGEDLRSAGVEVNDKRREWRADSIPFVYVARA